MRTHNATTVQQLADYFAWHVEIGNGACSVEIDMTSQLCVWDICQLITVAPPAPERAYNSARKVVMIDVVMEAT